MEKEEPNTFGGGAPSKYMVPKDQETPNIPFSSSHWTPPMQMYNNFGSTPIPFSNTHAAGSYMSLNMWPNQANNTFLQFDPLHDPRMVSNKPTVTGDAIWAFSVHRTFGERDPNLAARFEKMLQPDSSIASESKLNRNKSSKPKCDGDGVSQSAASGSKGSADEAYGTNNDISSTKKQECQLMLENANSTELNQTFGAGLNASGTNGQLAKDEDEVRRERKRQSNRESAKRSRMRKQQECEELHRNVDLLRNGNSMLTQKLKWLSEECEKLCNENESIEEELVEMYGPESIADLLPMKPV